MPIKLNARILFKNITTLGFTHGKARINTLGLNYFITLGLHMPSLRLARNYIFIINDVIALFNPFL